MIWVEVDARFTVCGTGVELLPLKEPLPAKEAVSVRGPGVVNPTEQEPAATVPVQESTPSETVTLPVGVPGPDVGATATEMVMG